MQTTASKQEIICDAIRELLADGSFRTPHAGLEWARYDTLARLKLPGPDYLTLLRVLHNVLKPKLYVEIGVRDGVSLSEALPETACIAIDPAINPKLIEQGRPNTIFAAATSDAFFQHDKNRERVRGFDLAFIDGDHSAEQAARDFCHLEWLSRRHSVIAIHDVIPMDERTATPQPTPFHTGDVWRLIPAIRRTRQYVCFTVACPPTGLAIIGRIDSWTIPGLTPYQGSFPTDWAEQVGLLNIVDNEPDAILKALNV